MANDRNVVFKLKQFPVTSETFIVNTIIATIEAGYKVQIIADTIHPIENSAQQHLITQYDLMAKVLVLQQPTVKNIRLKEMVRTLLSPKYLYFFLRLIIAEKRLSLDYVFWLKWFKGFKRNRTFHVHFATALRPVLVLKRIGYIKAPVIVTFHGYDAHHLPKGKQLRVLQNTYSQYIHKITTNSNYLKSTLTDKGFNRDQIEVVPMGIHTDLFRRKEQQDIPAQLPFKLITIGRLIALKGQDYGIKIVKSLVDRGVEVQYTIVGEGGQRTFLENLISKLNLENYVQCIGSKTQSEIIDLLPEHHVYLMTSTIDKDHRREAFGLVSVEAQALGLPVVGFDSGGFPETILNGETGCLINDKDILAAADTLERFINDRKLLETYSRNAQQHAHHGFDIKNINTKYTRHY